MTHDTLFIVDDEKTIREGICAYIEDDYHLFTYKTAEAALADVEDKKPDLVLLDIGLPGMDGIQALEKFKALKPDLMVIMITAYEDISSVIQCMRTGAYDYIIKPIQMESLEISIANALEKVHLKQEITALREEQIEKQLPCFIGESQVIHDILDYLQRVAKSPDTPVLILGETGTGKELIARTLHHQSPNHAGPFITVNCAAIPKDLIESELFGYEKGAFSGAGPKGKKGLIEMAHQGTLFLDEVGDLSLDAQAKLLRFMEEGEFYKVGGTTKRFVETRIVSATNKPLEEMIEEGKYRRDLFFRIGVIKINLPSLNDRGEDVLLFARHFLDQFNAKFNTAITGIAPQAQDRLKRHNWQGNVRELRNMMERGVLTAAGPELTEKDLGFEGHIPGTTTAGLLDLSPLPPEGIDLNARRAFLDEFYFNQAMVLAKGNETQAARLLNLKHHSFRYQYKKILDQKKNTLTK